MKREYAPLPYSRRARDGSHVGPTQALSFSANYLATVQWAPPPSDQPTPWESPLIGTPTDFPLLCLNSIWLSSTRSSSALRTTRQPDLM
eukprot:12446518-Prorocentrum_lima.AAC.1